MVAISGKHIVLLQKYPLKNQPHCINNYNIMKLDISKYTKERKTTAILRPKEKILTGDAKYINPVRRLSKKKKTDNI